MSAMPLETAPISLTPEASAPAGWRWERLTALARLESGHTPSRQRAEWWGGDVSWLSLTEIRALDGQWVESTQIRTNAEGIENSSARVLPRGTVCFSRTASVGFVSILAKPMATSQDFANWVCGDELDPEYLMYALMCSRESLRALATGATHKTIYMPTLEAFHICLPRRAEQEKIVKKLKRQLAAAEEARQGGHQQLRELALLSNAYLRESFDGASHQDQILGEVLSGVEAGKSLQTTDRLARDDELGILKVSAVSWTAFNPSQAKAIDAHTPETHHRVRCGDLLISRANTRELVGAVVLVERDYPNRLLSDKTLRLVVDESRADKRYLMFALRTERARAHFEGLATGSSDSMRNIAQGVITTVPIALPEIGEQRRLADRLTAQLAAVEQARQAAQAQLHDIEQLPARLLAQVFNPEVTEAAHA